MTYAEEQLSYEAQVPLRSTALAEFEVNHDNDPVAIKREESPDAALVNDIPQIADQATAGRKRIKKEVEPEGERRLVTDERRPRGERRLPRIYDLPNSSQRWRNSEGLGLKVFPDLQSKRTIKRVASGEQEVRLQEYVHVPSEG